MRQLGKKRVHAASAVPSRRKIQRERERERKQETVGGLTFPSLPLPCPLCPLPHPRTGKRPRLFTWPLKGKNEEKREGQVATPTQRSVRLAEIVILYLNKIITVAPEPQKRMIIRQQQKKSSVRISLKTRSKTNI